MAESRAETTGGGNIATEIPSKNLAPVEYADLPEPLPMKRVLGPSVLLLAGAIGSGSGRGGGSGGSGGGAGGRSCCGGCQLNWGSGVGGETGSGVGGETG